MVFIQFTMNHVRTDANIQCSISRRIVIDMQGWIPSLSDIDMATQSALCKTSFAVSMPRDPVVIIAPRPSMFIHSARHLNAWFGAHDIQETVLSLHPV